MHLIQNSNWPVSTLFRGVLAIVFMLWLANVVTQYDEQPPIHKSDTFTKQPPSKIMIELLTLPPVPEPAAKPQASAVSKLAKQRVEPATEVVKQSSQKSPVNKQQTEQVYQQLSDEGVDIQIAWPQNFHERQAALSFMYQCVGVQFAVLNGNNITQINPTDLSDYSDWIRVAQGSLSKKEHNWINAYALRGTPIRLFPRHLDWRLAQYLANALQGGALSSFRANYQVTNQRLQLTQMFINNQQMPGSWILYQGKC